MTNYSKNIDLQETIMPNTESQNTEYKESWRDEYLKWICGFANAQGGKLYIGIDDKGKVVGVKNTKKLMEDIPNKIQSGLGIIAEVNKKSDGDLDYIEIVVSPRSYPVSYHGEFHYRSGSTKQQLTGIALTEFIMKKTGVRWEDATVENISVDDLDDESFKIFRREALRSKRMSPEDLNISNEELLKKLHLISDGKLKRSAVLLFYNDPSILQNGSYVKIGKFGVGPDLQYQDTIEESLIQIADKVINLIYLKYLKAKITYENDKRVETYPFARDAIREAVYNALIHNVYMFGTPIQIRIEDEAIIISNSCILPEGWTSDTFLQTHESKPYNPDIANVFYRAGYIENWGRGIEKICNACRELGANVPRYEVRGNGIRVHFAALQEALIDSNTPKRQNDVLDGVLDDALADKIISELVKNPKISQKDLVEILNVPYRSLQRKMDEMKSYKIIVRKGGKRFGYWEINIPKSDIQE